MKDVKGKIALGILCGILGLIISMQLKTIRITTGGDLLSPQRAQQLTAELRSLKQEKEVLNQNLTELEKRLKEYEISEADENTIIRNLQSDLERYQILTGYRTLEGPGVIVTLEDHPSDNPAEGSYLLYNYNEILDIINKLNASGAEAISINDQRYTATTEIYYTTNNGLQVNGVPITLPIQIKAIGNPESMEAGLNMRFGVVWLIRENNQFRINVKKQNQITIPRQTKINNFDYAKPIELSQ
ncbi:DUF881 domain-containing protein [Alkaliphilus crotonatoxidans]